MVRGLGHAGARAAAPPYLAPVWAAPRPPDHAPWHARTVRCGPALARASRRRRHRLVDGLEDQLLGATGGWRPRLHRCCAICLRSSIPVRAARAAASTPTCSTPTRPSRSTATSARPLASPRCCSRATPQRAASVASAARSLAQRACLWPARAWRVRGVAHLAGWLTQTSGDYLSAGRRLPRARRHADRRRGRGRRCRSQADRAGYLGIRHVGRGTLYVDHLILQRGVRYRSHSNAILYPVTNTEACHPEPQRRVSWASGTRDAAPRGTRRLSIIERDAYQPRVVILKRRQESSPYIHLVTLSSCLQNYKIVGIMHHRCPR